MGRSTLVNLVVCGLAVGGLCSTAVADRITVRNGDDLQAAIDGAVATDTIVVLRGTYQPITLDARSDLTITGKGRPVIDGSTQSNCILLTNCQRVTVSGFVLRDSQLSGVLGRDCDTVEIRKCTVLDAGDEGIEFADCERITIDRNKIDGTQDDGIAVSDGSGEPTNNSVITRNQISNVPDGGIDINGDDNVISKNLVKDSEYNGIIIASGARNRVEKNRFLRIDGVGADIQGDTTTVTGNKIVKPTGNGIELSGGGGHIVSGNKVAKAGQAGIRVSSGANQVTKNKIAKSATADLQDASGGDTNTYVGNKAKVLDPPTLPNPKK